MPRNTKRIDKVLSNMGLGSRKELKSLFKSGHVTVDGNSVRDAGMHIDPEIQEIKISGEKIIYREFIYFMLSKPAGLVSATTDKKQQTVLHLLPENFQNLGIFPVGRLDKDTEGLLVLTNDGSLAHQLLSPGKHVPKKYFAVIEGEVSKSDIEMFEDGVILDDNYKTMPAKLKILQTGSTSEVEVVICEGKFHQIKRMFEAVGKKVNYLKRVSMGNLVLDENLKPGEYRELTALEIAILQDRGENNE